VGPSRRSLTALAAVLLALGGCGSEDDEGLSGAVAGSADKLQLVSAEAVAKAPGGSPQQVVLEWWRLMQYRNSADALNLFAPQLRDELQREGYDELVFRDFGPWLTRARPKVLRVERQDDHAVVFVRIDIREFVGPDVSRRLQEFIAIPLDRSGRGEWLIADDSFFRLQGGKLREARLKNERAEGERNEQAARG
jgi:hypothetical protein